ncbi:hypothetical protein [Croceibacter atlanticus]|uniref:hypothetical protein n=1 Tax=Croceibacter atlanticus TaxID=313588 RepID=UPI0030D98FB8|tara:strand:+ start:3219 stop:3737 length:519 start_codon:yes stop_codon:yes gene_type:complete
MPRITTHNQILSYFENLANEHTLIKGFYRFNWNEITSAIRSLPNDFVLLIESHAGDINKDTPADAPTLSRTISALVLAPAQPDDYNKQNEIFDTSECIVLDLISRIKDDAKGLRHDSPLKWLRGFNEASVRYDVDPRVPLFQNRYGYSFIIELPAPGDLCYNNEVKARFNIS